MLVDAVTISMSSLWLLDLIGILGSNLWGTGPKKIGGELAKRVKIAFGYSAAGNGRRIRKEKEWDKKKTDDGPGFFLSFFPFFA